MTDAARIFAVADRLVEAEVNLAISLITGPLMEWHKVKEHRDAIRAEWVTLKVGIAAPMTDTPETDLLARLADYEPSSLRPYVLKDAAAEIRSLRAQLAQVTADLEAEKASCCHAIDRWAAVRSNLAQVTVERDALSINVQSAMHEVDRMIAERDVARKALRKADKYLQDTPGFLPTHPLRRAIHIGLVGIFTDKGGQSDG